MPANSSTKIACYSIIVVGSVMGTAIQKNVRQFSASYLIKKVSDCFDSIPDHGKGGDNLQQKMQASAQPHSRSRATNSSASRTSRVCNAPSVATHSPDVNVPCTLQDTNVFKLFDKVEAHKLKKKR